MGLPVLFVCATRPEWGALKSLDFRPISQAQNCLLYQAEHPTASQRGVFLCQTGIGWEKAQQPIEGALNILEGKPRAIIHFGLSGALDQTLRIGDILLAQSFCAEGHEILRAEEEVISESREILSQSHLSFIEGKLFTSRIVLSKPDQKLKAGAIHSALAVDMETYPIASFCQKREIPYISLRVIFDPVDWDLTLLDEAKSVDERGEVCLNRIGIQALRSPRLLFSLPRYQAALSKANKAIRQALLLLLERKR